MCLLKVGSSLILGWSKYRLGFSYFDIFEEFGEYHPSVIFDIYTSTADDVKEKMDRGLLDLGLLLEPINIEKYEYLRMNVKERWAVMVKANSPLAKKDFLKTEDLLEYPIILPRRKNIQSELSAWFGTDFEQLNVRYYSNLSGNASILVEKGLGVSITIEGSVPFLDTSKVKSLPIIPEFPASTVFAWKKNQLFNLPVQKFVAFARSKLKNND